MTGDLGGPALPAHTTATNENDSFHATPEGDTLPDGFTIRRDGLYWQEPGRENVSPIRICAPLVATALTRDGDGHAWGLLLEWIDPDGRAHIWPMPRAMLAGDGYEVLRELMRRGLEILPRHRAKLVDYLARVRPAARVRVVPRLGWHETGTGGRVFVLPEETIGDAGTERIILQMERRDAMPPIRQAGTLDEWQAFVAALAIDNSRLAFAVAGAFTPPLLTLVGADGGGFHLRCRSSSGKTSTLRAAGSVWGGGLRTGFCASWRATDNGLEATAAAHNDLPLILDELSEVSPEAAGAIAYLIANGRGKARAAQDGGARGVAQWRVLLLSAGEISLADKMAEAGKHGGRIKAGQEMRLLDIPGDTNRFGLFETLHGHPDGAGQADALKTAAARYYGTAGRVWLDHLARDPEAAARSGREVQTAWLHDHVPANASAQVKRAADRFAWVAAAGELAIAAGILPWPTGEAAKAAATCFQAWREAWRGGDGDAEAAEAVDRVRGFLVAHGSSRFEPLDARDTSLGERTHNRAGWRKEHKGEHLFLIPPVTWRTEVVGGLDSHAAAKALRDAGYLVTDNEKEKRLTKKVRIGAQQVNVYAIRAEILSDAA